MSNFDAIVIGSGQAGPSLAQRLAGAGMCVAFIERHRFGGTCVNTGCMPTKTLVASAAAAHTVRRAGEFGMRLDGGMTVDMRAVRERKERIRARSSSGVESWLRGNTMITVYTGHARFAGPAAVTVNGTTLTAPRIFINVGGRALIPDIPGLQKVPYLTNSSMLDLDVLPRHLVVVGGSYIGLEFAQIYRRFGSEVTVLEAAPRLIAREDQDVSDAVTAILKGEGIDIHVGISGLAVADSGKDTRVSFNAGGQSREITGSHLLIAVGRRPNTDDLGLDAAGVATDARGYIVVDDQLRTTAPGIWALGDCNGRGAFTHTAYNDYEIVAANLLDGDPRRVDDRIPAYALFTDPPLGRAGMTEAEARKTGRPVLIARLAMERVGRAVERSETQGFMKILVDAETRQVLGASILGIGGDEVVQNLLTLMYAKAPYTVLQRAMLIHPTVSEYLPTMLGNLQPLPGG
jgi:pyruvate/2-oxoglutarate dehydrogenase complex dihydrolipoamide dehydrogenase (E3) component